LQQQWLDISTQQLPMKQGQGLCDKDDMEQYKHVRLSFQSFNFSQLAVFFSHNKSANSIFSRLFSAQSKYFP
jgi:hypothetical protein